MKCRTSSEISQLHSSVYRKRYRDVLPCRHTLGNEELEVVDKYRYFRTVMHGEFIADISEKTVDVEA